MKTIARIIILLTFCCAIGAFAYAVWTYADINYLSPNNIYSIATKVVEVDQKKDIVIVEDCNGELWEFTGAQGWFVDDICAMAMNRIGTDGIYDDKIISVFHSGTFRTLKGVK